MQRTPKYCHHKASDQAYATISGKVVYFGKYDSLESHEAYDRAIAKWKQLHATPGQVTTVGQLTIMFTDQHAQSYYSEGELKNYQAALKVLNKMFRTTRVGDFGPKKLHAVQEELAKYRVRNQVNICIARIKRVFEWGVSQEIVPVTVYQSLKTVKSLKRGRCTAIEGKPVLPVPQKDIDAVLPELMGPVNAMVRLQLLTGMRPGEVLKMKAGDVESTGDVWLYRPATHKNAWRGKQRVILIGPRGQDILLPFLVDRKPKDYLFNPHEGRQQFIESNYCKEARSHVRGSDVGENKPYTIHGYISSIQKACKRLKVAKWSPGQLRHNAATNINREFGDIDASRVVLGHSEKSTTEIYAERDFQKAAEVVKRIG